MSRLCAIPAQHQVAPASEPPAPGCRSAWGRYPSICAGGQYPRRRTVIGRRAPVSQAAHVPPLTAALPSFAGASEDRAALDLNADSDGLDFNADLDDAGSGTELHSTSDDDDLYMSDDDDPDGEVNASLTVLLDTRGHLEAYGSRAADAGTPQRDACFMMQRVLNKLDIELALTEAASMLLNHDHGGSSEQCIYVEM